MSAVAIGRSALMPGAALTFTRTTSVPLLFLHPVTSLKVEGDEFRFVLVQLPDGACRAYIVGQPGYRGRPTGLGATHRLVDGLGRAYVCWTPEIRDPDAMSTVLALWITGTRHYCRTGVFPGARTALAQLGRG